MRQLLALALVLVGLTASGAQVIPTLITTNLPTGTPSAGRVLTVVNGNQLAWGDGVLNLSNLVAALEASSLVNSNAQLSLSNLFVALQNGSLAVSNGHVSLSNLFSAAQISSLSVSNGHMALSNSFNLLSAGSLLTSNGLISLSNLFTALSVGSLSTSNQLTALSAGSLLTSNGLISLSNLFVALTASSLQVSNAHMALSNSFTAQSASFLLTSNAHQSLSNLFLALQTGTLSLSNGTIALSNMFQALSTSYLASSNDLRTLKAIQTNYYAGAGITFTVQNNTNITISSVGGTGIATNGGTGYNNIWTNMSTVGTQTNLGNGTSGRIDFGDTNGTTFVSIEAGPLVYSNAVFRLSTNGNGGFTTAIWVTVSNGGTNQWVPLTMSGLTVDMSTRTITAAGGGGTSGIATNFGNGTSNGLAYPNLTNATSFQSFTQSGAGSNWFDGLWVFNPSVTNQPVLTIIGQTNAITNVLQVLNSTGKVNFAVGPTGQVTGASFTGIHIGDGSGLTNVTGGSGVSQAVLDATNVILVTRIGQWGTQGTNLSLQKLDATNGNAYGRIRLLNTGSTDYNDMMQAGTLLLMSNATAGVIWSYNSATDVFTNNKNAYFPLLTAGQVLQLGFGGLLGSSAVSNTELAYLSGSTGPIQLQLNAKTAATNGFSTNQTLDGPKMTNGQSFVSFSQSNTGTNWIDSLQLGTNGPVNLFFGGVGSSNGVIRMAGNDYPRFDFLSANSNVSAAVTFALSLSNKTANYQILPNESGRVFSNKGTAGVVTNDLPNNPTNGFWCRFIVQTNQPYWIHGTNAIIRVGGYATTNSGFLSSSVKGSVVDLMALSTNEWYATYYTTTNGAAGSTNQTWGVQ